MKHIAWIISLLSLQIASAWPGTRSYVPHRDVPRLKFEISASYPHPHASYTQGLIYHHGYLIEGTGRYGRSRILYYQPSEEQAKVLPLLDRRYFGEGIALIDETLVQLTWKAQTAFHYSMQEGLPVANDRKSSKFLGQGWGLCHSKEHGTVLSDGSDKLKFVQLNPFKVLKTLSVKDPRGKVKNLNELEWVKGLLVANVWKSDYLIVISPETGKVLSCLDCSQLNPRLRDPDAALNGVAYDADNDRLFLTGKLWSRLYEVKLEDK